MPHPRNRLLFEQAWHATGPPHPRRVAEPATSKSTESDDPGNARGAVKNAIERQDGGHVVPAHDSQVQRIAGRKAGHTRQDILGGMDILLLDWKHVVTTPSNA